ncbi:MAG: sulfur carrier protein ThiS [Gammaproteobacteria bacterium]|nr:sulfur carrier protein ThiS [Gammaproteobacteria bacterium]
MTITLNGEIKELSETTNIVDLVTEAGLLDMRYAVEVNEEIVARNKHKTYNFKNNDIVEIVTAVGGG